MTIIGMRFTRSAAGFAALALAGMLVVGSASAAELYHRLLMQGQVLAVEDNSLVVCIGEAGGAKVGQELALVRHTRTHAATKASGPMFRREEIGRVRIAEIFDEHYARAEVLEGIAKDNDMVELQEQ